MTVRPFVISQWLMIVSPVIVLGYREHLTIKESEVNTTLQIIKNPINGVLNKLVAGAGFEPTTFGL